MEAHDVKALYLSTELYLHVYTYSHILLYQDVCSVLEDALAIHPKRNTMMPRHRIYQNVIVPLYICV